MIRPGVVWLSGRVIVTWSPTLTLACWEASSAILTWRAVEVIAEHRTGHHRLADRRGHARDAHRPGVEHHRPEQQLAGDASAPCADLQRAYRRGGRSAELSPVSPCP